MRARAGSSSGGKYMITPTHECTSSRAADGLVLIDFGWCFGLRFGYSLRGCGR
jgi:hypothetical protein